MPAHQEDRESGAALIATLLLAGLLAGTVAVLVVVTTTETLISGGYRHAVQATHAADAALERALHDLADVPEWDAVIAPPSWNQVSSFFGAGLTARAPDGRLLDLTRLTSERQRTSDTTAGPSIFGADSPRWRLFAHGPAGALVPGVEIPVQAYLVVWLADDGGDGDGDASRDTNGRILVHAEAFGGGGARRAVQAAVARDANGALRLLSSTEVR
jgi:hypothetical protein